MATKTGPRASQMAVVVKNSPANAGDARDAASIPRPRRSPGGGHGNPLQYYCVKNSMDRGAWWATVHGVTKSQTRLNDLTRTGACKTGPSPSAVRPGGPNPMMNILGGTSASSRTMDGLGLGLGGHRPVS